MSIFDDADKNAAELETTGEKTFDCKDFVRGMRDCSSGVPHESGKGLEYDTGYAKQYAIEQQATNLTEQQGV